MPHLLSRISTLQRLETLTLEYLIREKEKVDYTEWNKELRIHRMIIGNFLKKNLLFSS